MDFNLDVIDESEKTVFALRTLYKNCGYERYRMGKFEEYDLYGRNKDFLVSDSVITFTDTDGKLMALKPDVTLSIVKNSRDVSGIKKLYYNENVYRVAKGYGGFREIMQTGLECIGDVDDECISEVLMLAMKSLEIVSSDFILEVSDLSVLSAVMSDISVSSEIKSRILACFSSKNRHGVLELIRESGLPEKCAEDLLKLLELNGSPDDVLEGIKELCSGKGISEEAQRLFKVISVFRDSPYRDNIVIDFCTVSDMNYYNGITFRGFVLGAPDSVLSGGQYDGLMKRMGRTYKAVGFAVYLDKLHKRRM